MIRIADDQQQPALFWMGLLFFFALLFSIWPLPDWALLLRPEFAALLVLYAVLVAPFRMGMLFAWVLGLSIDVLESAVLGQHALALTVLAYLCFLLHTRIRLFSLLEQVISVFVLVGIYQLIGNWVQGIAGVRLYNLGFLLPALTSALLWPLALLVLERIPLFRRVGRS